MFTVLANKRKVDEATSNKDSVTPVYLLEDIWQIIQSSGPETSAGLVEYVNKRLAYKSPVVKQKTLRLIKYICAKGPSDFKRNISKHATAVRELRHFRGEPDAFKGDVPNQKVRDSAKEAMDAMFSPTDAPSYSGSASSAFNSRIQGFGSSSQPDGQPAAQTSSRSSGMLGFGNPRYESTNSSRQARSAYEAPAESSGRGEGLGGMMQRVGSGALSPKAIMGSIAAKGNELLQGRRGPSILNNDDQTGYSSDETDRGYEKPQINGSAGGRAPFGSVLQRPENGGGSGGDGRDEARLVDQICTPGGLRAQPTREDLAIFVESAGSFNGAVVAGLLADKMESTSWQASLRALCALEAVIQHGSTAACGEIAVFFQSDPSALEAACGSPQASVRQRAARVLQLLGVSEESSASAPSAAPRASGDAPDLLSGLDDSPADTAQPGPSPDLLGDLMVPAPAPTAGPSHDDTSFLNGNAGSDARPADLFQGLSTGPACGPDVPSSGGEDLFAGLSEPQAQNASGANMLDDLMGPGTSVPKASAASSGIRPASAVDPFATDLLAPSTNSASEVADIFANLSTNASPAPSRPHQQQQQQLVGQRSASLERPADPLSSLGLPQVSRAPMGQGASARGSSPQPFPSGVRPQQQQQQQQLGMPGTMQAGGAFPVQQLTPQQMQYLRQMQYMQYMQMQAMQARGMAGGAPFQMGQAPQQSAFQQPGFQQPVYQQPGFQQPQFPARQSSSGMGSGGAGAPISLDALTGASSTQSLGANSSSSLGISQQSDFDFVGETVKSLRGRK